MEHILNRRAVLFATEIGFQQCHFEANSEIGMKALQNGDMLSSSFGHLVRETLIHVTSLRSFSFSHIVRQGNTVAHALAQRARLSFPLIVWMDQGCENEANCVGWLYGWNKPKSSLEQLE